MSEIPTLFKIFVQMKKILEKLGFKDVEAAIYLSLLDIGESTVSDIAKIINVPRSSCYAPLENLISNNLVISFKIGKRRKYKAGSPDKLVVLMRERGNVLNEILPQLKSRYLLHSRDQKPTILFYEGIEGLKAIFEDILDKQFPIYAITSIDSILDIFDEVFVDFIKRRQQKHLPVKLLTGRTKESMELKRKDQAELRQTKFLPEKSKFETANFIYGNRMAIISPLSKKPVGLVIEDGAIVQTYKNLFEIVWDSISG